MTGARRAPLLAFAAAACAAEPSPVSIEDFPAAAARANCDWAVRCRHVPDLETCERVMGASPFDARRAADGIAAGRMRWDADAAGRCVATHRDGACLAYFADPSCDALVVGLVPEGSACTTGHECANDGPCLDDVCDGACCVGTCGPYVAPEPVEIVPIGGACDWSEECGPEAHCGFDRKCAPLPDEAGEPCVIGCAYGDLYCDVQTLECHAYAGLGGTCSAVAGVAPPCDEAWAWCDETIGVCRLQPVVGEACDPAVNRCVGESWCDETAGVCAAKGNDGEPCTTSAQCEIGCFDGACAPYETCTID